MKINLLKDLKSSYFFFYGMLLGSIVSIIHIGLFDYWRENKPQYKYTFHRNINSVEFNRYSSDKFFYKNNYYPDISYYVNGNFVVSNMITQDKAHKDNFDNIDFMQRKRNIAEIQAQSRPLEVRVDTSIHTRDYFKKPVLYIKFKDKSTAEYIYIGNRDGLWLRKTLLDIDDYKDEMLFSIGIK
ncbi:TPA: hypothetical protein HA235_00575 [Candidatus Woesearchaeota archaeon]|nr:hypothetical protein [Candidatus Woesearchaeota archaeon]HIH55554.1 hypothetical protein [Candidatus Woesearchaeota archaeon]